MLFGCLLIAACTYAAAGQPDRRPRALEATISRFEVIDQPFETALRELVRRAEGRFVVDFEVAAQPSNGKVPNLRLALENVKVE